METLTKHFRELTRAAFARHGFAQGDVITHWAEIAGAELADVSAPERIKWPRGHGADAQKSGGTLVIRAAPGRALDLQYEGPRIMARVNSYFGYGAIAQIKVVQAADLAPRGPAKRRPESNISIQNQELEKIDDDGLKAALARLEVAVAATRQSSPQGK